MEVINLNLIPNGTNPVVHVSQYDEGRDFRFNLFDGTSVLTLDGTETIECDVKKPDGNIVTVAVPNTSDSYIVVTTTLQMTVCGGNSLGTINISKGGSNLYTLNFVLYCERSPLENGIESESSIHNLESMVDGMVAEDVAEQYDSSNVIFDNEPTDNHGTGYTVTSEGIKTAIDNAFDYDNTASGSLVHITDGADNIPVKSLVSQIVAVESGNGQPKSPTNPYTISGHTEANVVVRASKNFFDKTTVTNGYRIGADGNPFPQTDYSISDWIETVPNIPIVANITFSAYDGLAFYDSSKTFIERITSGNTVRVPTNAKYIRVAVNNSYLNTYQLQYGTTSTPYEAYSDKINNYTFAFGQTVYGGYFDNNGNLVVTHEIIDLGDLTYTYYTGGTNPIFYGSITGAKVYSDGDTINALCSCYDNFGVSRNRTNLSSLLGDNQFSFISNGTNLTIRNDSYTDTNAFKTAMSGQKVVYELATPITLSITSQDIPTLLGENNIFSNCGDVEVNYYTNKANDILEFVDSEIGKKNGTNIPIEENSQDSIKDYIDNGLSGKADTSDLNDKQNKNVLNIVKHYDTGTSSDAITDIITEYGKVNMVFAFDIPLGYFTGCLTFANDNMGSGFIVLSTTGRFWVVSYVSGTITLTELT